MQKRSVRQMLVASAAIAFSATTALLVIAMFGEGSAGATLRSGRSVNAYSDSVTLKSQFTSDTATIETAGEQIIVKPTSLIVDGNTVARIEDSINNVEVHVKNGVVTFVADGSPVTTRR